MSALVECIPNFSEGRRTEVLKSIEAAIASIAGVAVLDIHVDPDHNRSVITFAGHPEPVAEAATAGARVAAERIDLRTHRGQHPRVGALDVLPFVPLRDISLAECAALAGRVGTRIADTLQIPVYLYESAAKRPDRRRLESIRKLGFEKLRDRLPEDRDLRPDLGPSQLHPTAGATFVGARDLLVAFNVTLRSGDIAVARRIAAAIRESGGGLPAVKALGLFLETPGVVQVSMNLVDYRRTGLATVFGAVRRLAHESGVSIRNSELVGLAPEAAFEGSDPNELLVAGFAERMILERALEEAGLEESTFSGPTSRRLGL